VRPIVDYLRSNPQAAILLAICIVLGFGTMIAVLVSMGSSGASAGGYDNGSAIMGFHALLGL
jgi:hypothetical protein